MCRAYFDAERASRDAGGTVTGSLVAMRFSGTTPSHDLTYSDVFLVPSRSEVASRLDVSLEAPDHSGATIPIVSANMNSVTGPRLAATLARRGGIGVLPQDTSRDDVEAGISWVKAQSVDFDTPVVFRPDETVATALTVVPPVEGLRIVLLDKAHVLAGSLDAGRLGSALPDARLGDLIHGDTVAFDADDIRDPRTAFDSLVRAGLDSVPVTRDSVVVGTISRKWALRSTIYRPALDAHGRLRVGAAIGVNGDVAGKAEALAAAGVDVLVIDTAHGHQGAMLGAIKAVARLDLGVPIVAGNVVTARAARDLVEAGASIVKVGVGPGAMCTTRMMTAVGRPQFSAVLEASRAASELGAHVWADGGVRYPRDVALALAAGASSVMIGSWFAGTIEAPGTLRVDKRGALYKESWGMASTRAVHDRFTQLDDFERARKALFAEGISTSTIYLDPLRPSIEDLLDMITSGVRSSLTYAGARTVGEFHERALVGTQSAAGYEEGKALQVSW